MNSEGNVNGWFRLHLKWQQGSTKSNLENWNSAYTDALWIFIKWSRFVILKSIKASLLLREFMLFLKDDIMIF